MRHFLEWAARYRVEIVAEFDRWPATDPGSDILSPSERTSIQQSSTKDGQAGRDDEVDNVGLAISMHVDCLRRIGNSSFPARHAGPCRGTYGQRGHYCRRQSPDRCRYGALVLSPLG